MAAMGNLLAQHRAVKTTTMPNKGTVLEYGISDPTADRAMTDDPTILWEKYESGATPDDVFYIEATGDYLVYYGLNDKRLSLFDSQGAVKWEKPISSGGRAAISQMGNTIAYSDDNELYVVNLEGTEVFHETFTYPVSHFKLTSEGEEFLGYARQVLDQTELIEERYAGKESGKLKFYVSAQHYSFAVEAFVKLLKRSGADKYEFHMRETQTFNIIDDVAHLRSEIGILYLNKFNEEVIRKTLKDNGLSFTPLFRAQPHVFIGKNSPLAKKRYLTLEDLKPYPRLSYEQGSHNSFYFSEEILSTVDCDKELIVLDRATLFNMLIGLNGYTICSGVINEELNGPNIIAKKLKVDDYMEIGYILPGSIRPSHLTSEYIDILKSLTA